ncbi:MAG: hypothetical protein ACXW3Z_07075 [Limisphaerales bacterium]
MNGLRLVTVSLAVTVICGCSSVESARQAAALEAETPAHMATASTPELTVRRAQIEQMIYGIQREVEMKAGLVMGVGIHDDRAMLEELYREARLIELELTRRLNMGDGGARFNTVKADY